MFIREKIGRYAGEIRDFPAHIARELIAAGRASNPFDETAPASPVVQFRENLAALKAEKQGRRKGAR